MVLTLDQKNQNYVEVVEWWLGICIFFGMSQVELELRTTAKPYHRTFPISPLGHSLRRKGQMDYSPRKSLGSA